MSVYEEPMAVSEIFLGAKTAQKSSLKSRNINLANFSDYVLS